MFDMFDIFKLPYRYAISFVNPYLIAHQSVSDHNEHSGLCQRSTLKKVNFFDPFDFFDLS